MQPRELREREASALRKFLVDFCAALPEPARFGRYDAEPGDRFTKMRMDVPDGTYRVEGSAWLLRFARSRFVGAELAQPPRYGGDEVRGVPTADVKETSQPRS